MMINSTHPASRSYCMYFLIGFYWGHAINHNSRHSQLDSPRGLPAASVNWLTFLQQVWRGYKSIVTDCSMELDRRDIRRGRHDRVAGGWTAFASSRP